LIEKCPVCDAKPWRFSGLLRASQGRTAASTSTANEIFYLFSPCPGPNKIIAGGEEGEFFGSTMPAKADAQTDGALRLAAALCALPKNLTTLSAPVELIFLRQ
jgi:hypothetical protein